jgi:polyphosphate kinase 2
MIINSTFPFEELSHEKYELEKRRQQVELLKLQEWVIKRKKRVAIVFEGRDAAGKGSTIKRFIEHLIPKNAHVIELGIPSKKQSKFWFNTYEKLLPEPGQIHFFDRSWYSRALIHPTMGYCSENQYHYFMRKIVDWEEKLIDDGLILIKFYLSVSKENQSLRFKIRQNDKLKYWKFSNNDLIAFSKWDVFTNYKEQMFNHTSTNKSPWVVINANNKMIARLNALRYVLTHINYEGKKELKPKKWSKISHEKEIELNGVIFKNLSKEQYDVLHKIKANS